MSSGNQFTFSDKVQSLFRSLPKLCTEKLYVKQSYVPIVVFFWKLFFYLYSLFSRPQRFLEMFEGRWRLVKKDQFVPYGFGRRICMGESLAKDNLFIFLSTLLKHIRLNNMSTHYEFARFENPVGHRKPDPGNYTDGLTVIPHPYHVNVQLIRQI